MGELTLTLSHPMSEEDWDVITDSDLDHTSAITYYTKHGKEVEFIKPIRCKDCKYFEIKDYWTDFNGVPVLGASNQPACMKWGGGDCLTSPDGYCHLAERR